MLKELNNYIFNLIKSNININNTLNYYYIFIPKNVKIPYLYLYNTEIEHKNIFNKNIFCVENCINIISEYTNINELIENILKILMDNTLINTLIKDKYQILDINIINIINKYMVEATSKVQATITFKVKLLVL